MKKLRRRKKVGTVSDQRNMTFGMRFGLEEASSQLEKLTDHLDEIKRGMIWAEQESDAMADRVSRGSHEIERGFQSAGAQIKEMSAHTADSSKGAEEDFRKVGRSAESMGEAVIKSADTAMKSTDRMGTTIKAGMGGAVGFVEKRFEAFGKNVDSRIKRMGNMIKHPIRSIKDGLAGALNKARESLEDVGTEAGKAKEDLDDVRKSGEDAGMGIKDALGGVVAKLVALKAGIEVLKSGAEIAKNFAVSIYETGVNAEKLKVQFGSVFADDDSVGKWAENFASGINRSRSEVQEFLISNKTLYSELGFTGERANELSKVTTSLAYDLGAAFKMDDAEALSVLQDYINGNTNALMGYGVQIDDTVLKKAALQMGIRKEIEDMSDAEAAQVRMNALLENSTSIQRQAEEAELGYANGAKSVKARLTDLKEEIGAKFEPVFSKVVGKLLESWPKIEPKVMSFFDKLATGLSETAPALLDMAVVALPQVIGAFSQFMEAAGPIGGVLTGLATTALPPLIDAIGPLTGVISNLAQTVLPPFGNIIGKLAQTVIPPLVEIITMISEKAIKPLMPLIETIAEAVIPVIESGIKALIPLLGAILPILEPICSVIGDIVGFLGKVASYVSSGIGTVIDKVAGLFNGGGGKAGADIPHNASGTQNFKGGWTHINEQGGEMAYLPGGSTIIPADKSQRLIDGVRSGGDTEVKLSLSMPVHIQGNADQDTLRELEERVKRLIREEVQDAIKKALDKKDSDIAIQEGYT